MELKSKKVLLIGWGCENKQDTHAHQIHYMTFKKIFPKLVTFDSKKNYFKFGKDVMNKNLLDYLKTKEFDLLIFLMDEEEFYLETIIKARNLQPSARTLFMISDDDLRFSNYSRYLAILFDHTFTSQYFLEKYKKDKIKDVSFILEYNNYKLEPMDIEKKYDVTFIGRPKANRSEILKYLIDNGIKIHIFGWDWHKYPELRDFYKGPLNQEDYARITNETKVNICLTKAGLVEEKKDLNITGRKEGRINGRVFEIALCKSFELVQFFPEALELFKENEEMVFFKTKEELLEKIKYYLKHEKERERIAEKTHKKIISKYNREKTLTGLFKEIFNKKRKEIKIPEITKKIALIKREELEDIKKIKNKLKKIDYVYFSDKESKHLLYKNNFQAYSLEKTGKDISCCEYYIYSKTLGNYMRFRVFYAFKRIGKKANKLININQLMMKKEFFLENIESIKKLFNNKEVYLINDDNTAFVSLPLVSIKRMNPIDYESMTKSFDMIFLKNLFSILSQKKIFSLYPYKLFLKSLYNENFILTHIINSVFTKHNWDKLFLNKAYVK